MCQHLCIRSLTVSKRKAVFHFNRITCPIKRCCFAQQGASAPIKQAANNLVLWIVIRGLGIFIHVEPSIATQPTLHGTIGWCREALQAENSKSFAIVQPIKHHGEFFVVHPVSRERNFCCFGACELSQVPFPGLQVHL